MSHGACDDKRLRQLFSAARRADRVSVPRFAESIRAATPRHSRAGGSFRSGFVAGGVTSLIVAGISVWIVLEEPQILRRIGSLGRAPVELAGSGESAADSSATPPTSGVTSPSASPETSELTGQTQHSPRADAATTSPTAHADTRREAGTTGSLVDGGNGPARGVNPVLGTTAAAPVPGDAIGIRGGLIPGDTVAVDPQPTSEKSGSTPEEHPLRELPQLSDAPEVVETAPPHKPRAEEPVEPKFERKRPIKRPHATVAKPAGGTAGKTPAFTSPPKPAVPTPDGPEPAAVPPSVAALAVLMDDLKPKEQQELLRELREFARTLPAESGAASDFQEILSAWDSPQATTESVFVNVAERPFSSFPIDVGRSSLGAVRRSLERGKLPPRERVRTEEMIAYFDYDYAGPRTRDPLAVDIEIATCPWNTDHRLARLAIQAGKPRHRAGVGANIVLLVDVSSSMRGSSKLPLVRSAIELMAERLGAEDQLSIVTYSDRFDLLLYPTTGDRREEILDAVSRLHARRNNDNAGFTLAYQTARSLFSAEATNRVVLLTDGDLDLAEVTESGVAGLIGGDAAAGILLTGVGLGDRRGDDEQRGGGDVLAGLAEVGGGGHFRPGSLATAEATLVGVHRSALPTVADEVRLHVEFNPMIVAAYRLIGYETAPEPGDGPSPAPAIVAGQSVTVLYEIVPADPGASLKDVDHSGGPGPPIYWVGNQTGETLTLTVGYRRTDDGRHDRLIVPVIDDGRGFRGASPEYRFASAVAAFGMLLKGSPHAGEFGFGQLQRMIASYVPPIGGNQRDELHDLVIRAASVAGRHRR